MRNGRLWRDFHRFLEEDPSPGIAAHKAFVAQLKKQVSSDAPPSDKPSSGAGESAPVDEGALHAALLKEIEAKFNELFGDPEDDD